MKYLGIVPILLLAVYTVKAYKVLGVFPLKSMSHHLVFRVLMGEMARQGHNVTVITTHPLSNPPENYRELYNETNCNKPLDNETVNYSEYAYLRPVMLHPFARFLVLDMMEEVSSVIMNNISDVNDYDVIFIDSTSNAAFSVCFGIPKPVIGFSSFSATLINFEAIGMPIHPAFYNHMLSYEVENKSIINKFKAFFDYFFMHFIDYMCEANYVKTLNEMFNKEIDSMLSLEQSMDMLFMNIHPILNGITPSLSTVINLDSLHVKEKIGLPKDIQTFLDASNQGAVYMSLGSNVKSVDLPDHLQKIFVETFSLLPFNVIWKFEGKIDGLPNNVFISEWVPQLDVLAHPNVRIFMTQGGRQSIDEAVMEKVPMLGIPFFVDQFQNVNRIKKLKIGLEVMVGELSATSLKNTIYELMFDKSYSKNIERLSNLVKDKPRTSLEEGVWWTLYTLRHKGTSHLRSPSADISNFEFFLCDVVFVYVLLAAVIITCLFKVLKCARYRGVSEKNVDLKDKDL